ncbi:hypothetical protein ACFXPA_31350 [Amycolatopsis sp. NPDC059090]|uniref:hypothetical protein n=1 Tax=Amycolatopsis sp. NPDC059090 TaxID=3346723 RepID=UPI00366F4259
MDSFAAPAFAVVSGQQVNEVLAGAQCEVVSIVESAYLAHGSGATVNPPSCFLRFPDRPDSRIIALPASVGGDVSVDGIKWISSVPGNIEHGLPRASAVLILNDPATGYPYACLESSIISAARTAAGGGRRGPPHTTRHRTHPKQGGCGWGGRAARRAPITPNTQTPPHAPPAPPCAPPPPRPTPTPI